jgi:hypothetical protein
MGQQRPRPTYPQRTAIFRRSAVAHTYSYIAICDHVLTTARMAWKLIALGSGRLLKRSGSRGGSTPNFPSFIAPARILATAISRPFSKRRSARRTPRQRPTLVVPERLDQHGQRRQSRRRTPLHAQWSSCAWPLTSLIHESPPAPNLQQPQIPGPSGFLPELRYRAGWCVRGTGAHGPQKSARDGSRLQLCYPTSKSGARNDKADRGSSACTRFRWRP